MRWIDQLSVGLSGLTNRVGRTVLSALGIAIGIAAIISVVGVTSSSRADLLAQLDELGTNTLRIQPGQSVLGEAPVLPIEAEDMVAAVNTVTSAAATTRLAADVQRSIYDDEPNGLLAIAVDEKVTANLGFEAEVGRLIDSQLQELPVAVLGSVAAQRLDITSLRGGPTVTIADSQFQIIGVAKTHPLYPDLDRAVMVGTAYVQSELGVDHNATTIYAQINPKAIEATRPILAQSANPGAPSEVDISRPSDALEARAQVDQNLRNLLLALGVVALLIGGIGIANIMVISVHERRAEIGLRRALGANRASIRRQFVIESAALAALGGVFGVVLGAVGTIGYALSQDWKISLPLLQLAGAVGASLILGAAAGLYPASKAARLQPADAIRSTR